MRAGDPELASLAMRVESVANDIASDRWRARVTRPAVEGCGPSLEATCPKRWESLGPTDRFDVRHCSTCSKGVTFCTSTFDARQIIDDGGCVVLDPAVVRSRGDLWLER